MRYGLKLEDLLAAGDTWLCPHCYEEDHPEEVLSLPVTTSLEQETSNPAQKGPMEPLGMCRLVPLYRTV